MTFLGALSRRLELGLDTTQEMARKLLDRAVPVILLDDVRSYGEQATFQDKPCIGWSSILGAPADVASIQLANAIDTGIDIILEQIWIDVNADQTVQLFIHNLTFGAAGIQHFRDLRLRGAPAGQVREVTTAQGLAANEIGRPFVGAARTLVLKDLELLIPPRQNVIVRAGVDNTVLTVEFLWREMMSPMRPRPGV